MFFLSSHTGVILVSFGSLVHQLPDHIIEKMLHTLSHYDHYEVIFKYGGPVKAVPENIHIVKWMQQNDLLAHPKMKLFINHGGMNSVMESIYHRVPMIVFPFAFDQLTIASYVQAQKFGKVMDIAAFTEEELIDNIEDILTNTEYVNNVKEAGDVIREMKTNNVSNPVFWIDHVIKYGTKYVRSKAYDLPTYQYLMLDVLAVLVLVFVVVTILMISVVKMLLFRCCKCVRL